eukprot:95678-Chlamydomonas_euryale.AAC.10
MKRARWEVQWTLLRGVIILRGPSGVRAGNRENGGGHVRPVLYGASEVRSSLGTVVLCLCVPGGWGGQGMGQRLHLVGKWLTEMLVNAFTQLPAPRLHLPFPPACTHQDLEELDLAGNRLTAVSVNALVPTLLRQRRPRATAPAAAAPVRSISGVGGGADGSMRSLPSPPPPLPTHAWLKVCV